MGRDYLLSVHGLENVVDTNVRIENMGGLGIGQKKLANFLVEVKARKEES
jgi:hypothetical protein